MKSYLISQRVISTALIVWIMAGCAAPQSTPTPSLPSDTPPLTANPSAEHLATTRITVDGSAEDWSNYEVIGRDPSGDQVGGSPDLSEARAFSNDRYFYLLIKLHEEGKTDHYDILIDVNGGDYDYQLSVWPDRNSAVFAAFPVSGGMSPIEGVEAAQDEVIEVKMPLSAVNHQSVRAIHLQTWLGDRVGDQMADLRAVVVNEADPGKEAAQATPGTPQVESTQVPVPLRHAVFPELGLTAKTLLIPDVLPWFVNISPDDKILVTGQHTETIFEVTEDSSVEIYATFPGMQLVEFYFDPSGHLWFSTNRQGIYRVDDAGKPVQIAREGTNRRFDFDSQGNLYAVDFPSPNIQKITTDGTVNILVDQFSTNTIVVGPQDEILSMDSSGRLVQIMPDGQLREIANNIGIESNFGFAPDGTLYALDSRGLLTINVQTGTIDKVTWYGRFSNVGVGLAFDSAGNMYTYHPNHPIHRVIISDRTSEMVYHSKGNTTAMALDPEGTIYLAYGNELPSGESIVYRLTGEGTLEEIASVPYGIASSLAFDSLGTGYLGVSDRDKGQMIFTLDPAAGSTEEWIQPKCIPQSMAADPSTGYLWWSSCNTVHYKDETGEVHSLPILPNTTSTFLFFGPDGRLYAIIWFGETGSTRPVPHGVYTLETDGSWTELADLTNNDPFITWAMGAVCPDNRLYVITHTDAREMGIRDWRGTLNGVLRLEPDGSLKVIAGGFSVDNFAVACDPQTGDLIFTSIAAIFRLYDNE